MLDSHELEAKRHALDQHSARQLREHVSPEEGAGGKANVCLQADLSPQLHIYLASLKLKRSWMGSTATDKFTST